MRLQNVKTPESVGKNRPHFSDTKYVIDPTLKVWFMGVANDPQNRSK
jgi:hypothetical protein